MEEGIRLLQDAKNEIRGLRRQNELMRARLDMFDNMVDLLNTNPSRKEFGMSPDLCYEIDKFINSKTTDSK